MVPSTRAGFLHEGLLELFRSRLTLAPELLERLFGVRVPAYTQIEFVEPNLTQLVPTERRADLVVLLRDGRPVLAIVVEIQLRIDERKRFTWPVYVTSVRARHECPVELLVVTVRPRVATWASRPIEIMAGQTLTPRVLGPGYFPEVGGAEARRAPELAVLSAIAHARTPRGPDQALAAIAAIHGLDDELRPIYYDLIAAALPTAARRELEAMALNGRYEYQSDFAKRFIAEGREKGREEGLREGRAALLLEALEHRGFDIDASQRARLEEASAATLKRWMLRLLDGADPESIFTDD